MTHEHDEQQRHATIPDPTQASGESPPFQGVSERDVEQVWEGAGPARDDDLWDEREDDEPADEEGEARLYWNEWYSGGEYDTFGPYATLEDAEDGYERLIVSAAVEINEWEGQVPADYQTRVYGPEQQRTTVNVAFAQAHPHYTKPTRLGSTLPRAQWNSTVRALSGRKRKRNAPRSSACGVGRDHACRASSSVVYRFHSNRPASCRHALTVHRCVAILAATPTTGENCTGKRRHHG